MRCDQCQFWAKEEYDGWEARDIGFRACEAVEERWNIADRAHEGVPYPQWDHADEQSAKAWADKRSAALKDSRAFVEDGSDYHAVLVTGPDFFCALFKQK